MLITLLERLSFAVLGAWLGVSLVKLGASLMTTDALIPTIAGSTTALLGVLLLAATIRLTVKGE